MQGHRLLHKFIEKSATTIHQKRIRAVTSAAGALLEGKQLTLTGLGRSSLGKAKERHAIRGMDRLLGNKHLQLEQEEIYKILASYLINKNAVIAVLVDWSCINKRKGNYLLRASVALKGRSHVIYQEVHAEKYQNSPLVENSFLKKLVQIIPAGARPIIVTDAGFRAPWFKAVRALGLDFLGRVRNKNKYRIKGEIEWKYTSSLYENAATTPEVISEVELTKSNVINCNFVLIKKEEKGRKRKNRCGNPANNNESNRAARRASEPWLLATSLSVEGQDQVNQSILLYEKRMQIEEEFRDTKSHQFGFAIRNSLTNDVKRLEILLLIAALACFACWLIALSAQRKKLQYDYQSNSTKDRTVLSVTFLACRLFQKRVAFTQKELLASLNEVRKLANLGATL